MEEIVKKQPEPEIPKRHLGLKVEKAIYDEYERVFDKKVWIHTELAMLVNQYMRDRLASYKNNHRGNAK